MLGPFPSLTVPESIVAPARGEVIEGVGSSRTRAPVALEPLRVPEAIAVSAEAAIVPVCREPGTRTGKGKEKEKQRKKQGRVRAGPTATLPGSLPCPICVCSWTLTFILSLIRHIHSYPSVS